MAAPLLCHGQAPILGLAAAACCPYDPLYSRLEPGGYCPVAAVYARAVRQHSPCICNAFKMYLEKKGTSFPEADPADADDSFMSGVELLEGEYNKLKE